MNIFVGNLPYRTAEAELRNLFSQYGEVSRASIITDKETGQSRGFAFVQMATRDQAQTAISKLDGLEFAGRQLVVNEAKPRESNGNRKYDSERNYNRGNFRESRYRRDY